MRRVCDKLPGQPIGSFAETSRGVNGPEAAANHQMKAAVMIV